MAHLIENRKKIRLRINRIQGQLEAVKEALDQDEECSSVLQILAASRGAMNGLMAEILEGHILSHLMGRGKKSEHQNQAALELIRVLKSYLK